MQQQGFATHILAISSSHILRFFLTGTFSVLFQGSFVDVVGVDEKRRAELEAKVLNSQLCRIKEEDPAGLKCRSYGA